MARLSISDAIKQSGVSRSSFYAKYVSKGLISVSEDKGKKYIDTSELLRVFGELKGGQSEDCLGQSNEDNLGLNFGLDDSAKDEQIKLLKQQLEKSEEREQFYQEQIASLSNRLEAPAIQHKPNPFTRWWRGL